MGFVEDSFTDTTGTALASHTGEVGATWAKHGNYAGGNMIITDANRSRSNSSGTSVYYASGTDSDADYAVSAVIHYKTSAGTLAGIIARSDTSGSIDCYVAHYHQSNARWELYKYVGGTGTLLGNYSQALSAGVEYTLKLECIGTAIKVYIDGVQQISVTDSSVTATGVVGLIAQGSATNTTGLHTTSFLAEDVTSSLNLDCVAAVVNISSPVMAMAASLAMEDGVVNASSPVMTMGLNLTAVAAVLNGSSPALSMAISLEADDGIVNVSSPTMDIVSGYIVPMSEGVVNVSSPTSAWALALAAAAGQISVESPVTSMSIQLTCSPGSITVSSPTLTIATSLAMVAAEITASSPVAGVAIALGAAAGAVSVLAPIMVITTDGGGEEEVLSAVLEVIARRGVAVETLARHATLIEIRSRAGTRISIALRLGGIQ